MRRMLVYLHTTPRHRVIASSYERTSAILHHFADNLPHRLTSSSRNHWDVMRLHSCTTPRSCRRLSAPTWHSGTVPSCHHDFASNQHCANSQSHLQPSLNSCTLSLRHLVTTLLHYHAAIAIVNISNVLLILNVATPTRSRLVNRMFKILRSGGIRVQNSKKF